MMNPNMGNEPMQNNELSDHANNHHLTENGSTITQMLDLDHGQLHIYSNNNVVDSTQMHYVTQAPTTSYEQFNVYHELKPVYHHIQQPQMQQENGHMYDPNQIFLNVQTDMQQMSDNLVSSHGQSPPPPPRVYKPCVVCNDKSSGYHYGVSSCEGCKGFFRRSVQKNMQYTCHKEKACVINKVTRNRCQYCRLQTCFRSGMSKEAVRNDRHKKKKLKAEGVISPDEVTEPEQSLIQSIVDAQTDTYTSSFPDSPNNDQPEVKTEADAEDSSVLWEKINELSSTGVVKIVEFAKKIPGFMSLVTTDQITLLKAACLEIMILRLSTRYDPENDSMVFENNCVIKREQLKTGGFGPLTDEIFKFALNLREMDVDETEFALLSAICLTSSDRSGLENAGKIEAIQEPIHEALKHYSRTRRKENRQVFARLLMKVTELRSISVKGIQYRHIFMHADETMSFLLQYLMDSNADQPSSSVQNNGIHGNDIVQESMAQALVTVDTSEISSALTASSEISSALTASTMKPLSDNLYFSAETLANMPTTHQHLEGSCHCFDAVAPPKEEPPPPPPTAGDEDAPPCVIQ